MQKIIPFVVEVTLHLIKSMIWQNNYIRCKKEVFKLSISTLQVYRHKLEKVGIVRSFERGAG